MTYGAALHELAAPDRGGRVLNVVLGFPTLEGYLASDGHYFGATVGRYANRIAGAAFSLDGIRYGLDANDGRNSLHGGSAGLDKRLWELASTRADAESSRAHFRYTSPDGEMGYPGRLELETSFVLSRDGSLRIAYRATTDRPTVVNLTNHALWNLAGEGNGTVDAHLLRVDARRYLPVDGELIPTGEIAPVAGTPFDFTRPVAIGRRVDDGAVQLRRARGYDHTFVLDRADDSTPSLAARLEEPRSGRVLEVLTTEPGLHVYSGNFLDGRLRGPSGRRYVRRAGIGLETQHFPDSPHHDGFPTTVLRPGGIFTSTTCYRFAVERGAPVRDAAGPRRS